MRQGCRERRACATRWNAAGSCCAVVVALAAVATATAVAQPPAMTGAAAPTTSGLTAGGAIPYWQAPALPSAVIQGGAIPSGWVPQAVPYQGIGPDGRPVTQYFAPARSG